MTVPGATWLAFVDSIASSPTVRLALSNDAPWRMLGADLSAPPLQRAVAGTLLADGQQVPAAAYDNRSITLRLQLQPSAISADAAATAIQTLVRELDRPNNILRWWPDSTNPVFFRTLRSDPGDIDWDATTKEVAVRIMAEPFAYGLKQTLSVASVTNDPAAGGNAMFFDVTAPLGDVETPLFLQVDNADITNGCTSLIAVRRGGTPSAVPFFFQCEAHTLGTDTTLPGNDVLMSGTGSNYARCSFATGATLQSRVTTTTLPASPSVDARGTYQVYLRYRKSVAGDSIQAQFQIENVINSAVTLQATTNRRWVNLGQMSIPQGMDPVADGYSNTAINARGLGMRVNAGRTSGAGNLDMDVVILVPADDKYALITWVNDAGTFAQVADPARSMVYPIASGGEIISKSPASIVGALPMINPNVANRVYFIRDVGTAGPTDDKTSVTDITPYYWPRYLFVRPATT